ncbi:hypothetical protein HPB51_026420 [Rhipicephalus microplus]|uniref:Transmembrane protein n=1 Tax=Rhipicephalus microplus TaxID=6941 RepID=A0A9J6D3Q9_RHIMP|nr:hypothetical protein HPB51_026420 [Rhipicephalus microplus]
MPPPTTASTPELLRNELFDAVASKFLPHNRDPGDDHLMNIPALEKLPLNAHNAIIITDPPANVSYFRVAPQRLLKRNAADYQRQSLCRSHRAHAATTTPSSTFAEGAAQRSASQWCHTREHGATAKMRQAGAKCRATSSQPTIPPSPHVGQQDTDNVVSGRKSEPTTTTNQSAAATTTPRPSLEGQRETAIIPGYQHQWTTVGQPLLAATSSLSPHNEQRHLKVASGKESEQVTTNQFETARATPLSPWQESSIYYGDKDQFTTLKQPLTTLTSSLSPYDGQWHTDKMSSGKENEPDTANHSMTALTTPLLPWESRQEQSMIPEDERVIVIQSLTAPTSSLSSHNGQQWETFIAAVTGGVEDERTTIRTAPVVTTASNPTSPLSPQQEGHHEAAQTTTAVVATTAATTTMVAASSPLDHVLFCGHGGFQTTVLVCTTLAFFTAVEHVLASTNLARPVDHWCKPPARYSYIDPQAWKNVSIPLVLGEDVTERRSQCEPPLPYAELSAEYPDNRTIVPCDSGREYDTGDSHLHFIVDEWNLVCKRGCIVSALAAASMAGGVVGSAVIRTNQSALSQQLAGVAADHVGQRPLFGVWLALLVPAGTTLAFSNSGPLLAMLRFLLSACAAGVLMASHVLLFDVTNTQHHVFYGAIAVAATAFVATVYTEVAHVLIRNWHAAQEPVLNIIGSSIGLSPPQGKRPLSVSAVNSVLGLPQPSKITTAYLVEEMPCWLLAFSEMHSRAVSSHRDEPHLFRHRLSALRVEICR